MNYQESKKLTYPVKLLLDYYKYFANLDGVKAYVENQWTYDRNTKTYSYNPQILVWSYKTRSRIEKGQKLLALIRMNPDMHCEEKQMRGKWHVFDITYVNPELPSIKNNDLGFERNV